MRLRPLQHVLCATSKLDRWPACEKTRDGDVFVDLGPVNAFSMTEQLILGALLRISFC